MLINCDIGESGVANPRDDQLMAYIDIANIACGGHAGNKDSVNYYYALAKDNGVDVSVHLSYPDPDNFGRVHMDIDDSALLASLDQQYQLLSEVKTLKLHGALYNEANQDRRLAQLLIKWAIGAGIQQVLSPENSEISKQIVENNRDMNVVHEVFLDRRYILEENILRLKSRAEADALISETSEALTQYQNFMNNFLLIDNQRYGVKADTACVHSDTNNSLDILRAISALREKKGV